MVSLTHSLGRWPALVGDGRHDEAPAAKAGPTARNESDNDHTQIPGWTAARHRENYARAGGHIDEWRAAKNARQQLEIRWAHEHPVAKPGPEPSVAETLERSRARIELAGAVAVWMFCGIIAAPWLVGAVTLVRWVGRMLTS